ncbi:hypothetical protein B0H10DRAFT_1939810 [Mycena sp. CBHHK59/15]|nr:hypothetical protein B0H10DRAFT_1939810 [Mycena sp. CBHHK59/15]
MTIWEDLMINKTKNVKQYKLSASDLEGLEVTKSDLKKLCKQYKKTHAGKEFQQPDAYRDPNGSVSIVQLSPSKILSDRRASTPRLLRFKEQFLSLNLTWLWDTGNEALKDDGEDKYTYGMTPSMSMKQKEGRLSALFDMSVKYPSRPTSLPPDSASFTALRDVLHQ